MLDSLLLQNFKCFESLELPLRALTVLSGTNGGGKSSVIQALVLLSESVSTREWARNLLLDGPTLPLGSAADVLNHRAARRMLAIGACASEQSVVWSFEAEQRRNLTVDLAGLMVNGERIPIDGQLRWLMPIGNGSPGPVVSSLMRANWISAERIGPRDLLPLRDPESHHAVGARGEFATGLVHWRLDSEVQPRLCLPGSPPTLYHQVRSRMQQFFPGFDYRVSPVKDASAISLTMRTNPSSDFQRPQNVGFGLTQLFPIVVSVLAAESGDILLVENPEVHLHPRAQQTAGVLLAQAAAAGIQVVVETHSDHVLNGVRLATKSGQVEHQNVAIHFFSSDLDTGEAILKTPSIDINGRLSEWPPGFFDQFDRALSELM